MSVTNMAAGSRGRGIALAVESGNSVVLTGLSESRGTRVEADPSGQRDGIWLSVEALDVLGGFTNTKTTVLLSREDAFSLAVRLINLSGSDTRAEVIQQLNT